ncbi:MAG TPA: ferritin-like domain-containing protein [Oscillatoriaceae cyanobacterium]
MSILPVNVRESSTTLKQLHRALMNEGSYERDWSLLDREAIAPDVLATMIEGWRERLAAEYRSAAMASEFQNLLLRCGAPLDMVGVMGRITQDEVRHVHLCAEVIEALGGDPSVPISEPSLRVPEDPSVSLKLHLLDLTVYLFCMCETVSSHLLETAVEGAEIPPLRAANRQIAKDELLHKQYGWLATAAFIEDMGDEARTFLQRRMPDYFPVLEGAFASGTPAPDERSDQRAYGILSLAETHRAFYEAVETDILPNLEKLGFPATAIWQNRKAS